MFTSCGQKKTDIVQLPSTSKNTNGNLGTTAHSIGFNNDTSRDIYNKERALEKNLDQFYKIAVVQEDEANNFDTKVNYQGLYNLKEKGDANFVKLVRELLVLFEDPTALEGKSDNFKIAFYLNAYNFYSILLVTKNLYLKGKKISSIRDIRGTLNLNRNAVFKNKDFFILEGQKVSLEDIAQGEQRSAMAVSKNEDARIAFALACAAQGCPPILNESYKESELDSQLNFITGTALKLERIFHNDKDKNTTYLGDIFDNYKDIFNRTGKDGVKSFIERFSGSKTFTKIKLISMDWSLNQSQITSIPSTNDVSIANHAQKRPCENFLSGKNTESKLIAICSDVLNSRLSKSYKYSVERVSSSLCLVETTQNNKRTLRFAGSIEEYDDKDNDHDQLIDISSSNIKEAEEGEKIKFEHKDRHISDFTFNHSTMVATLSQRYRFWSLDMFQHKKRRSFSLSCQRP